VLWDKASLVSADENDRFYVDELRPFVSVPSVGRQPGSLQQQDGAEVKDQIDPNDVTLYGSTQLAVDLAELAAEAGDVTLAVDIGSAACPQTQTGKQESNEPLTAANERSEEKTLPGDVPLALDGFCLQSSSVRFVLCTVVADD